MAGQGMRGGIGLGAALGVLLGGAMASTAGAQVVPVRPVVAAPNAAVLDAAPNMLEQLAQLRAELAALKAQLAQVQAEAAAEKNAQKAIAVKQFELVGQLSKVRNGQAALRQAFYTHQHFQDFTSIYEQLDHGSKGAFESQGTLVKQILQVVPTSPPKDTCKDGNLAPGGTWANKKWSLRYVCSPPPAPAE